jgi:hypothetical protein
MDYEYLKIKEAETETLRKRLAELNEENKKLRELINFQLKRKNISETDLTPHHSCL